MRGNFRIIFATIIVFVRESEIGHCSLPPRLSGKRTCLHGCMCDDGRCRNQGEGFFCDVVIARLCTSAARQLKQRNQIPTARFPLFCKIGNFLSFFLFRSPNRVLCSTIMLKWSPSHRARVGTPDPSEVGSEVASITSEQAGR